MAVSQCLPATHLNWDYISCLFKWIHLPVGLGLGIFVCLFVWLSCLLCCNLVFVMPWNIRSFFCYLSSMYHMLKLCSSIMVIVIIIIIIITILLIFKSTIFCLWVRMEFFEYFPYVILKFSFLSVLLLGAHLLKHKDTSA